MSDKPNDPEESMDDIETEAAVPQNESNVPDGMPGKMTISPPVGPDEETGEAVVATAEPSE
jgi:hypothetical protein